jgi:predicted dinucleotide-binding enzyme
MRIGILGTGTMADVLGTRWVRAGHELMIGGRDRGRAAALAGRLGAASGGLADAAAFGDGAVLLAVPAGAAGEVLAAVGEAGWAGRTLIDCTNPIVPGRFTLAETAGAERIAAAAPGARVVKAFNLCHAGVWRLDPPVFDGAPLGVPLCGDDPDALAAVRELVTDLGCTPLDGGGLERARLLEATAAFAIGLWLGAGQDARSMLTPLAHAGLSGQ